MVDSCNIVQDRTKTRNFDMLASVSYKWDAMHRFRVNSIFIQGLNVVNMWLNKDTLVRGFIVVILLLLSAEVGARSAFFPKPKELEPDVAFWKKVYTEITTTQGYIHDDRYLNIIYETIQLEEDIDRRKRDKLVNERKRHYRDILLTLAEGEHEDLDEETARVLALWPKKTSPKEFKDASRRLRFQLGQSDKFKGGLTRSSRWMAHIRETMRREGLPMELAALPHVESSFDPSAYSYVGAAGMWQFTRSTGRRYMRVDHVVDERLDPFISSEAAAKLLKHNYSVTGSWPLAITAYNHGIAGMRRAMEQTGGTDIVKILREYDGRTFKFASRNFYVAFLAAVEVHRNAEHYFGKLERDKPDQSQTIDIPFYIPAKALAKSLDVDIDLLRVMNPALRPMIWSGEKLVPKGFSLRIPAISTNEAAERIASIDSKYKIDRQLPDLTYRVRRGDTLSGIADRYGVGVYELKRINNLRSRHFIRAGQTLRLPKSRRINVPTRELVDGTYRVQPGDTLSQIADAFSVSQTQLMEQNNLRSRHRIHVGQVLNVTVRPEPVTETGIELAEVARAEETSEEAAEAAAETVEEAREVAMVEVEPEEPAVEPIEQAEAVADEAGMPIQPAGEHPELSADPANYEVTDDDRIYVQAAETLGHYAEWLELRAQDLRDLNGLRYRQALILGSTLKLDFSKADRKTFEERRTAYHRNLQEAYFAQYRITGVEERKIRRGDSVWELTHLVYRVPLWLFRQYNPDVDLNQIKPGTKLRFPRIEEKALQG